MQQPIHLVASGTSVEQERRSAHSHGWPHRCLSVVGVVGPTPHTLCSPPSASLASLPPDPLPPHWQSRTPVAVMPSGSPEKRIHLLLDVVPDGCALVIVGDGTAEYAVSIAAAGPSAGRVQVLPQVTCEACAFPIGDGGGVHSPRCPARISAPSSQPISNTHHKTTTCRPGYPPFTAAAEDA